MMRASTTIRLAALLMVWLCSLTPIQLLAETGYYKITVSGSSNYVGADCISLGNAQFQSVGEASSCAIDYWQNKDYVNTATVSCEQPEVGVPGVCNFYADQTNGSDNWTGKIYYYGDICPSPSFYENGQCITEGCPDGQEPDPLNPEQCKPIEPEPECTAGQYKEINWGPYYAFKASDISITVPSPVCYGSCEFDVTSADLYLVDRGEDCGDYNGETACGTPSIYTFGINTIGNGNTCSPDTPQPECTTCLGTKDGKEGGEPVPEPTPEPTRPESEESTTVENTKTEDGGTKQTITTIDNAGNKTVIINNYDASGNLTSSTSSEPAEGENEKKEAECDPSVAMCEPPEIADGGFYTPTPETLTSIANDGIAALTETEFGSTAGNFLSMDTLNSGTCEPMDLHLQIDLPISGNVTFVDTTLDAFCSELADDAFAIFGMFYLVACSYAAFKIAVL